jgi:ABC-type sugar transport system substrate-binding protein
MVRVFLLLFGLYALGVAQEYKVGFPQDTLANDWRLAQVNEAKKEALKYPFLKLEVKDSFGKVSNQIANMEYFIYNQYDCILTSPITPHISSLVLKKAREQGIKVVLISRGISSDDYDVFIRPNNKQIGQKAAQFIAKKLNYKGVVLILEGIKTATTTIERTQGFLEEIKRYENIKTIQKTANFLRSDAIKVMEELYKEKIKIDAIFSHSDSMLSGVRTVMREFKIDPKSKITVGIDYIKEAKEAIKKGEQTASFIYPTASKEAIEAIVKLRQNKPVPKDVILETTMVTSQNVHELEPIF